MLVGSVVSATGLAAVAVGTSLDLPVTTEAYDFVEFVLLAGSLAVVLSQLAHFTGSSPFFLVHSANACSSPYCTHFQVVRQQFYTWLNF